MSSDLRAERMCFEFQRRFQVAVKTDWNIFSNSHVTERVDGKDFTSEQIAWLNGYELGRLEI
jgi:hypothetical protein